MKKEGQKEEKKERKKEGKKELFERLRASSLEGV